MPTFAYKAIRYFTGMKSPSKLPSGIGILSPYEMNEVKSTVAQFYQKFYDDERMRIFILGINPGRFGGVKKFFSHFFLSAVYPLALIYDGKNYNYYDSKKLFTFLRPQLMNSLKKQTKFGADRKVSICLGKKNAEYLKTLNDELKLFERIETLEHPRFIMQYRKKKVEDYIKKYLTVLNSSLC